MTAHHLAQLNIGRMLAPLDDPRIQGFVDALEPVNALADSAPGFVWRLQTEDGDATAIRPYDDDLVLVNMSTWESVEALAEFVYRTFHAEVMRGRRQWFAPMREAFTVLWWVPAGHRPSVDEAQARLELLRAYGPTPDAFSFRQPFAAPGDTAPTPQDDWFCPA